MKSNHSSISKFPIFEVFVYGIGFFITAMVVFMVGNQLGSFITAAAEHRPLTSDGVFSLVAVLLIASMGTGLSFSVIANTFVIPFAKNQDGAVNRPVLLLYSFAGIFVSAVGIYLFTPAVSRILQDPYPSVIDGMLSVCWIQTTIGGIIITIYGMLELAHNSD